MSENTEGQGSLPDPFEQLDFAEEIKSENWVMTSLIHTPTMEAALSADLQELTLTFVDPAAEEGEEPKTTVRKLARGDIEALARYLAEYAQVGPLVIDASALDDIHPRRVDL